MLQPKNQLTAIAQRRHRDASPIRRRRNGQNAKTYHILHKHITELQTISRHSLLITIGPGAGPGVGTFTTHFCTPQHFIIVSFAFLSGSIICFTTPPFASHASGTSFKHTTPFALQLGCGGAGVGVSQFLHGLHFHDAQHRLDINILFVKNSFIILLVLHI